MAFLVGLLLTPVAALAGTLVIVVIGTIGGAPSMPLLIMIGLGAGSLLAAPVTVLALPATYALLRRRSSLRVWRLALAGGAAGIVSVLLFEGARHGGVVDADVVKGAATVAALGCLAGTLAGACFGYVTRWLRPDAWRGAQASPSA